jgi:hypothetical protein
MLHQSLPAGHPTGNRDQMYSMQDRLDGVLDENVTLKLRVSELESDIIDEKHHKQVKYDFTVDHLKSQVQADMMDNKVKYEEKLFTEKETNHKLTVQLSSMHERI